MIVFEKMTQSIFVSYRRIDAAGHAGRLFDRLRHWFSGEELFFDVSTLETGDVFPEHIDRAVRGAKAVLVVMGPDWMKVLNDREANPEVDFVRQEVAIAIQRRNKGETVVLPVLVGNAAMPSRKDMSAELQEELGRLLDIQAHVFPSDQAVWDFQFDRLRKRLSAVTGVPTPHFQSPLVDEQPPGSVDQLLGPNSSTTVYTRRPSPLFSSKEIQRSFDMVSRALLDWPQETEGQWIGRPELDLPLWTVSARETGCDGTAWRTWGRQIGHPCPAWGTAFQRGRGAACHQSGSNTSPCGDLADIALTLHRLPETRTRGLDLFERMMELDAFQLNERLKMIDRPAFLKGIV